MSGKIRAHVALFIMLAALAAVLVPSGLASGSHAGDPDGFSNLPNDGVLRLELNGTNELRYQVWNGSNYVDTTPEASVQSITATSKCLISLTGDDLVGLAAAKPVGLVTGDIGAKTGSSKGTPCGEVDKTEDPLTISLSQAGPLADKEIDYAELDIEGKHNVAVSIHAYLDGSPVPMVDALAFDCETPVISDCGPDSGDGDNFRVIVAVEGQPGASGADVVASGLFDRLDMSVSSSVGEFSLNGGADGTIRGPLGAFLHTSGSVFHLTDVANLVCDEETNFEGDGVQGTVLLAGCSGESKLVFFTSEAVEVGDGEVDEVSFGNVGGGISGSYTLERWIFDDVPEHSLSAELPVGPDTRLWYNDDPSQAPENERVVPYCKIDPRSGDFDVPDDLDPGAILPGVDTTCLIVDQRTVADSVQGVFILFSIGDPARGFR